MGSMRPLHNMKKEGEISEDRHWNDLSWHSVFTHSHKGGTHIKFSQDCAAFLLYILLLPPFLFTSSQFVTDVCNIKFLFLAPSGEETGLHFTLCAKYVHVDLFLTVITAAESIYAYHLPPYLLILTSFLLSEVYAVSMLFACITVVRDALKSVGAEQGQTTVE